MSMTPLEIALERIKECRSTRSPELDLSKLGLDAIPEPVFELAWLEKLDVAGDRKKWEQGNLREIPAAIGQLTALREFDCTLNQISDLSPLRDLPALQTLDCSSNQISDLSPLRDLPALQTLYCDSNQISDLSPLRDLPALQGLSCWMNQIIDLSPLRDLPTLQVLSCSFNQIIDLSPLRDLPTLQALVCSSNQIIDLSPLRDLPTLQALVCSFNQISDLSPLCDLPALQTLDCSSNQINNLTLRDLPALQTLDCRSNQISDLSPLRDLPALQTLDCRSNQISDLSPLRDLPALQELDCSSNQISDLSPLCDLPALQTLDCSSNQISDLSPLRDLPALQELDCRSNQISDLSPLRDLPALQTLYCDSNQISDLSPLRDLPALQRLDCSSNQISDLSPLHDLPALQRLDCDSNQISDLSPLRDLPALQTLYCDSNQISDLSPLCDLPALQTLDCRSNQINNLTLRDLPALQTLDCRSNQINNLTLRDLPALQTLDCRSNQINNLTLRDLPALQTLDCSSNQINNLTLRDLPALQTLDCSYNQTNNLKLRDLPTLQRLDCSYNQISDLSPLRDLPALQKLTCGANEINDLSAIDDLLLSDQLQKFSFHDSPKSGIPSALLGSYHGDNCLENIKHYRQAILLHGSVTQKQLKIQLVGNGRVGKTTLAIALETGKPVEEDCASTHGITIKTIPFPMDNGDTINLNVWDFGGQEIYHATHRLFLSSDCLYLLLWAEETEENDQEIRHSINYWLEAIQDLGGNSPIIIVKNQRDRAKNKSPVPPELAMEELDQECEFVSISAKKYQGIYKLRGIIEEFLYDPKLQVRVELPNTWVAVQEQLEALKATDKSIAFSHFRDLCMAAGIDYVDWFVDYLHKIGVLFYQKNTFQDQVILDQNWVIDAAYRVFDPNGCREDIEDKRGKFKGKFTRSIWSDVDDVERQIYLDFMRNCGICYEPQYRDNQYKAIPFAEREFIIPALLPPESKTQKARREQSQPDDWLLVVDYPFLHRSIIERLILRLGETYDSEVWRTGIFCETEFGEVLLHCEPATPNCKTSNAGQLQFYIRANQQPNKLVQVLRKLVKEISPQPPRYKEYLQQGNKAREALPPFDDEEVEKVRSRLDPIEPTKTLKLFISYSRADREHKLTLEKHLRLIKEALKHQVKLIIWSDHLMDAGEGVNDQILPELRSADLILLLVSPDFLDPERYSCRIELPIALERHEKEKTPVIPVIVHHTLWQGRLGHLTVATKENANPREDWPSDYKFWGSVQSGIQDKIEKLLQT
ncbi:leucine-rich repeat domain-containing protein [Thiothrix subterranea]|uniref:non-specific serine/threonine protein kinase n=1 Tax=Thiothrix subterranea TaxID=2735563 RepID=A0AA51R4F3_9GAMM|nr:leucine-rich repeat domain-containing protein [Thiothrix subterranea]WML86570.1 leucine-rich repeat domain-containing protein [Thiothrix subterranea]